MIAPTKVNENNNLGFLLKNAFFDWYGCSIPKRNFEDFIDLSVSYFGAEWESCVATRPYSSAQKLMLGEETILTIKYGGINEMPYIVSTSHHAPAVADFIRDNFIEHYVSRFDSAIDFDESGAFESLVDLMMLIKEKHKLKVTHAGDWSHEVINGKVVYTGEKGRTLYIGSRKSVVYFRLYEKGKEQIDKMIDKEASKDWVRLELEIKPQKRDDRLSASRLKPCDAFSCSRAAVEVGKMLDNSNMPRIRLGTTWKDGNDLDIRAAYLWKQYGNTIKEIVEQRLGGCGDDLFDYFLSKEDEIKKSFDAKRSI